MITLKPETANQIRLEMESITEKYQKPFNSVHEGLAVLREEYVELENEIFFGEKKAKEHPYTNEPGAITAKEIWKAKIRREAIQVAAMAARIIQELT
jgi:hypothetical protein